MPTLRLTLSAVLLAFAALFGGPASSALAVDCQVSLFDDGGYLYDFEAGPTQYAALRDGGSNGPQETPPGPVDVDDSWDGWGALRVYSPGSDLSNPGVGDVYNGGEEACEIRMGGREVAFPVTQLHGLQVQRRWYVDPGRLNGARSLTVLHNPTSALISVTVAHGDPGNDGNLGSQAATGARATSDGTGIFSPASSWGVTTDGTQLDTDLALAHLWDGMGGAMRAVEVVLGGNQGPDTLYWDWQASVPAGATAAFISYEIQAGVASRATPEEVALAAAQADARLKQSLASLYIGMSSAEIAGTMNWPRPQPVATIAPVGKPNAARPVLLDGRNSIAAEGLPQCAISGSWQTDDGAKGSGTTLSHFFAPGRHTATLTVTSDCGGSATAKATFKVASGLQLGKVKLNRANGTAKLGVRALGAGKLTLSGKGVKKQARQLTKAGKVSLTLKPTGKLLRALVRDGKAKTRVTVDLKPRGGKVSRQTKAVVLRRVG